MFPHSTLFYSFSFISILLIPHNNNLHANTKTIGDDFDEDRFGSGADDDEIEVHETRTEPEPPTAAHTHTRGQTEEEDVLDADEFIGVDKQARTPAQQASPPKPPLQGHVVQPGNQDLEPQLEFSIRAPISHAFSLFLDERTNYYPEMVAIAFVILYAINFFIGRKSNDQIAQRW